MENNTIEDKENKSQFDPQAKDSDYYSQNPYQHGTSDYGQPSEGVGTGEGTITDNDQSDAIGDREKYRGSHEHESRPDSHGSTQEWDVDPEVIAKNRRDAQNAPESVESGLPSSVEGLPDNPSDEALFVRKDATYLEEGDDPSEGYDPHNLGYSDEKDDKK